MRNKPAKYGIK
ncbi:unnamed protein product, partial [Didymodactylos carnosus]